MKNKRKRLTENVYNKEKTKIKNNLEKEKLAKMTDKKLLFFTKNIENH